MDISGLDTSQTTKFNNMFANCMSIKEIDISKLNTDNATTISRMFNNCRNLESIDVSKINTANTTELVAVFEGCYKLKEIEGLENWDVSKVKNVNSIFRETSIEDLSGIENWDVSSLNNINSAFYKCSVQSLDLSAWNVSNLKSLHYSFARSGLRDLNITGWDLTGLNSQSYAFEHTGIIKLDMAKWNNSNISEGYPRENAFVGMAKLQEIKLNPKFVFHGNDGFNTTPPTDKTYTGKWQAEGAGTVDNPQGEVFTVEELRTLYSEVDKGPLETYVWEKVKPVTVDSVHFIIHIASGTADKALLEQMNPKLKDGEGNEFTPSGIMDNGYTFEFKDIPVGKYTLTFEYPTGYKFKDGVTVDNIPYLDTGSEVDINQFKDSDFYTRLEKIKDDPEYTSIDGQKTWLKDKESDRPESITVKLVDIATGKTVQTKIVKAADGWKYTFENVLVKDSEGKVYSYRVEEIVPDGYKASYNGYDITNTKKETPKPPKPSPDTPSPKPPVVKKATAVLANGEKYTDVLTATVLANEMSCPILLTEKDNLTEETFAELQRRGVGNVIISGGVNSVSEKVVEQLSDFNVIRYSGKDRYETAREIGDAVRELTGQKERAVLVDGTNFPDVITISALASQRRAPILITQPSELNTTTGETIKDWGIADITIGGQVSSVSEKVENDVKAIVSKVDRIGGADRYETASLIGETVRKNSPNKTDMILVDGTNFPDGITVNSLAAKHGVPIHLTNPKVLTETTKNDIQNWSIKNILVVGGQNSVSEEIYNSLNTNKERLAGSNRYITAVKISQRLDTNILVEK